MNVGQAALTQSVTYRMEGLNASRDADSLKASLREQRGVRSVDVSPERGEARVVYEPSTTDSMRIAQVIESLGYRVTNKQPWGCP